MTSAAAPSCWNGNCATLAQLRVAGQQADQRIAVAEGVELEERETAVRQREDEHRDAQVAAVPEQRQESAVEPRQRADREDDMQQRQRERTEGTDQQRLGGDLGTPPEADADEDREVERGGTQEHGVVALLPRRPADGDVAGAHRVESDGKAVRRQGRRHRL